MKLLLGILLVVVAVVLVRRLLFRRRLEQVLQSGTPIDDDDPLMLEAMREARASLHRLRPLSRGASQAWVKFQVRDAGGDVEHVWGSLEVVEDEHVVATWRMPVVGGIELPDQKKLPLAEIEDWQVELPDGAIHGGFTTRAQIAIARRDGYPVPDEVLEQERRFVDRRSVPSSDRQP